MENSRVSDRHKRYLLRFERSRKRWESPSTVSDIRRLRHIESTYFVLLLCFLGGSKAWLEVLVSPSDWWMTVSGGVVGLFVVYVFYDLYWVARSINYMIDNRYTEVAQFQKNTAGQGGDGGAEEAV